MSVQVPLDATAAELLSALADALVGLWDGTVTPAQANALRREVDAILATKEAQLRIVRVMPRLAPRKATP